MFKYQIIYKKGQGAKTKYYYYYTMADSKEEALTKFRSLNLDGKIAGCKQVSRWL